MLTTVCSLFSPSYESFCCPLCAAIEALSVDIDRRTVHAGGQNVNKLQNAVAKMEKSDAKRLQDEYQSLGNQLQSN